LKDERLDKLASSVQSKKITYLQFGLMDSPLLCGHPDRGLNFTQVQDADAFAHVLRAYDDYEDPLKAFQGMESDFILKDLEAADQSVKKIEGELKKGRKEREKESAALKKCQETLRQEKPLRGLALTPEEMKEIRSYGFLSQKPLLVVFNIAEGDIGKTPALSTYLEKGGFRWVAFCAKTESELFELKEEERQEFMKDLGIQEPAQTQFIRTAFQTLELISFFTYVGEEARAWALEKGTPVLKAAGEIHSDIARGFIKAEVFSFQDFMEHGSVHTLKEKGLLRLEGKEYVVKDGDVLNIKFSV
ncbi:MAG: DUF933 domain-containing protein, partial [Candidatus Omnitrophota bacterium]